MHCAPSSRRLAARLRLALLLCAFGAAAAGAEQAGQLVSVDVPTTAGAEHVASPPMVRVARSLEPTEALPEGVPRIFQPTDEWVEVLPGQMVPGGLEYRIDIEQGKRWARNMAPATRAPPSLAVPAPSRVDDAIATPPPPEPEGDHEPPAPADAADELMRRALPPSALGLADGVQLSEEELRALRAKVWAQRQEQLQAAFKASTDHTKEMGRALQVLLRPEGASDDERVGALELIEEYSTKLDFARDLHSMGGLALLVDHLSASSSAVAAAAAWAIGTAVKNDEVLQLAAVQLGASDSLGQLLLRAAAAAAGGGDDARAAAALAKKGLYALGALLRGNARAQEAAFVEGVAPALTALARQAAVHATQAAASGQPRAAGAWAAVAARAAMLVADLCWSAGVAGMRAAGLVPGSGMATDGDTEPAGSVAQGGSVGVPAPAPDRARVWLPLLQALFAQHGWCTAAAAVRTGLQALAPALPDAAAAWAALQEADPAYDRACAGRAET